MSYLGRTQIALIILAVSVSSCATPMTGPPAPVTQVGGNGGGWVPTIDTRGVKPAKYQQDLADCTAYAKSDPSTNGQAEGKKKAMKWGLGTALGVGVISVVTAGAALPFILPTVAGSAALTGGAAALTGGYGGKTAADAKYRSIVASCLGGRGYHVLG